MTPFIHLCHWSLIIFFLVISMILLYGLGLALLRKDTGRIKAHLFKLTAVAIGLWLAL